MDAEAYSQKKTYRSKVFILEATLDFFNQRLKIEDFRGDIHEIVKKGIELVAEHQFKKIIVFTPKEKLDVLLGYGFVIEALFKQYFNGNDAWAVVLYFESARKETPYWIKEDEILTTIRKSDSNIQPTAIPPNYLLRKAKPSDSRGLAKLYNNVFQIYPTPLTNEEYLQSMIKKDTVFYLIEYDDQIISGASADINFKYHHAELTDCATLPQYRKAGLMKVLLKRLEEELKGLSVFCAFSIARSLSYGMNASLYQLGYSYTGRMANNCYIFDKLEDMNVWVKDLTNPPANK